MFQSRVLEQESSTDPYLVESLQGLLPKPAIIFHKLRLMIIVSTRSSSIYTEVDRGTPSQSFTSAVVNLPSVEILLGYSLVAPVVAR